jgi:hypothetical protein
MAFHLPPARATRNAGRPARTAMITAAAPTAAAAWTVVKAASGMDRCAGVVATSSARWSWRRWRRPPPSLPTPPAPAPPLPGTGRRLAGPCRSGRPGAGARERRRASAGPAAGAAAAGHRACPRSWPASRRRTGPATPPGTTGAASRRPRSHRQPPEAGRARRHDPVQPLQRLGELRRAGRGDSVGPAALLGGRASIRPRSSRRVIAPYRLPGPSRTAAKCSMSRARAWPCLGPSARLVRMSTFGSLLRGWCATHPTTRHVASQHVVLAAECRWIKSATGWHHRARPCPPR